MGRRGLSGLASRSKIAHALNRIDSGGERWQSNRRLFPLAHGAAKVLFPPSALWRFFSKFPNRPLDDLGQALLIQAVAISCTAFLRMSRTLVRLTRHSDDWVKGEGFRMCVKTMGPASAPRSTLASYHRQSGIRGEPALAGC